MNQKQIAEIRKKNGIIYRIYCKKTGESYIGKSVRNFFSRYNNSRFWWKSVENSKLKNYILKYGHKNFGIEILEYGIKDKQILSEREIFYAEKFNAYAPSGFNLVPCGDSNPYPVRIKSYSFRISPSFDIIEITNLVKFCRENDLDHPSMLRVSQGKLLSYGKYFNNEIKSMAEYTIKRTEKLAKTYEFQSPSGEIIRITNLRLFCRKNHLCHVGMRKVFQGKTKHHKGWRRVGDNGPILSRYETQGRFFVLDSDNQKVSINNMSKFCREHNLDRRKMDKLKAGIIKTYAGFKSPF